MWQGWRGGWGIPVELLDGPVLRLVCGQGPLRGRIVCSPGATRQIPRFHADPSSLLASFLSPGLPGYQWVLCFPRGLYPLLWPGLYCLSPLQQSN